MTLAEELAAENERLRRRFVHATRPKGLLSMDQARDLAERMAGIEREPVRGRVRGEHPAALLIVGATGKRRDCFVNGGKL